MSSSSLSIGSTSSTVRDSSRALLAVHVWKCRRTAVIRSAMARADCMTLTLSSIESNMCCVSICWPVGSANNGPIDSRSSVIASSISWYASRIVRPEACICDATGAISNGVFMLACSAVSYASIAASARSGSAMFCCLTIDFSRSAVIDISLNSASESSCA